VARSVPESIRRTSRDFRLRSLKGDSCIYADYGRQGPWRGTPLGTMRAAARVGARCGPLPGPGSPRGRGGQVPYRVGGDLPYRRNALDLPYTRLPYSTYPAGACSRAPQALPGTARTSHTPSGSGSRAWQSVGSACVRAGHFAQPQSIFEIPHTKLGGGNRLPARDPPGARAHSH
jgi:hypothetical protein